MAYMGRGGFSSFGGGGLGGGLGSNDNDNDNDNNNNNDNRHNGRMYYRGGFFRMYYYIPLDNTYVIFQMIAAIIIFTIAGITFLATYKPSVVDPIEDTKRLFMNKNIIFMDEMCYRDSNNSLNFCEENSSLDFIPIPFDFPQFDIKKIDYAGFMNDLSDLIARLNYKIISVSIDKENYLLKRYQFNIYNTAMCFLLQRYIYVMPNNKKGIVMLEARGKDEDYILLNEMKHIIFETGIKNKFLDDKF